MLFSIKIVWAGDSPFQTNDDIVTINIALLTVLLPLSMLFFVLPDFVAISFIFRLVFETRAHTQAETAVYCWDTPNFIDLSVNSVLFYFICIFVSFKSARMGEISSERQNKKCELAFCCLAHWPRVFLIVVMLHSMHTHKHQPNSLLQPISMVLHKSNV